MLKLQIRLQQALEDIQNHYLWREKKVVTTRSLHSPKLPLRFTDSGYLGLSTHPEMLASADRALKQYGISSCASPVVSGYTESHAQLEENLAKFFGFEAALVFSSGFLANSGILKALIHKQDAIVADKEIHASLINGILASGVRFKRYPHIRVEEARAALSQMNQQTSGGLVWWITDGIFSMRGSEAPVSSILEDLSFEPALIIDDAHGIGVLGKNGRGVIETQNVNSKQISLLIGTFSKALGGYGAFALGSKAMISYLTQTCRSYIYNTALPPIFAETGLTALRLVQSEPERRQHLINLIGYFREIAECLGLVLHPSSTPIQFVKLPSVTKLLKIQKALIEEKNIWLSAIRAPSVAKEQEGFRICLNTNHTTDQIEYALLALKKYMKYD